MNVLQRKCNIHFQFSFFLNVILICLIHSDVNHLIAKIDVTKTMIVQIIIYVRMDIVLTTVKKVQIVHQKTKIKPYVSMENVITFLLAVIWIIIVHQDTVATTENVSSQNAQGMSNANNFLVKKEFLVSMANVLYPIHVNHIHIVDINMADVSNAFKGIAKKY